jgi:hypothetical protein
LPRRKKSETPAVTAVVDDDGAVVVEMFDGFVVGVAVGCDLPQPIAPTAKSASAAVTTIRCHDDGEPVVVRSRTSTGAPSFP